MWRLNNINRHITTVTPDVSTMLKVSPPQTNGVTVVIYKHDKKLDDKIKTSQNNVATVFSTFKKFAL